MMYGERPASPTATPFYNSDSTLQHSYRYYQYDYVNDIYENERADARVHATLKHIEDGRLYAMLDSLNTFVNDLNADARRSFFRSNPRLESWLELYRDVRGIDGDNGLYTITTTPESVEKALRRGNKSTARERIRSVGSGAVTGTFHHFLEDLHQFVVLMDPDEIESFFDSNPRIKTWLDVYARSEEQTRPWADTE